MWRCRDQLDVEADDGVLDDDGVAEAEAGVGVLVDDVDAEAGVEGGRMGNVHATLGGEGGYHLRLAGGCVLSKVYLAS